MKINVLEPTYYEKFACIGPDCEYTCCANWRILVTDDIMKRYKKTNFSSLKSEVKKYIKKDINDGMDYIELDENNSCKFLDKDMLCSIQKRFGEKELPWGCRIYPRKFNYIDGRLERGIVFSCPEACRLVLFEKDKLEFKMFEKDSERIDDFCDIIFNSKDSIGLNKYFWEVRIFIINLLQERKYSIQKRLLSLGMFIQMVDKIQDSEDEVFGLMENFAQILESNIIDKKISEIDKLDKDLKSLELAIQKSRGLYYNHKFCRNILDIVESDDFKENFYEFYKEKIEGYLEESSYMLENYLVNKVFIEGFPYYTSSLDEKYSKLILDFEIFKLWIYALSYKEKEINEKIINEAAYTWSRTGSHNKMIELHLQGLKKK